MKFTISRETLLKPLQMVVGVVERRQTLPILSNVLLKVKGKQLSLIGTDLEVELIGRANLEGAAVAGEVTVPARKLMDICRTLPEQVAIDIYTEDQKVIIKAGRSRFTLSTLPASDFPSIEDSPGNIEFSLKKKDLRYLIKHTHFAMAQQDVRYYLNGMLLETSQKILRTVATDGHRLALSFVPVALDGEPQQIIVPRKGILEILRLLDENDDEVAITVGSNHIRVSINEYTFISKLIDGRFPDYDKVLPKGGNKIILIDKDILEQALSRVAILSNEKYRGVCFQIREGVLNIRANNPEQEEAEEELPITYSDGDLEIGFNVSYLLDVLNCIAPGEVKLTLSDANSSVLIEEAKGGNCIYVVMPMRL